MKTKIVGLLLAFVICETIAVEKAPTQAKAEILSGSRVLAALRPVRELRKDNYETTADFNKRVCLATEKALNVRIGEALDIAHPSWFFIYDADKRAFVVNLHAAVQTVYDDRLGKYLGIGVEQLKSVKGTYEGKNAYGATKTISSEEYDEVILLLPGVRGSSILWKKSIRLPSDAQHAREIAGDLRLVIRTRLKMPCFITRVYRTAPTISYPVDATTILFGLYGAPGASWRIERASTGEVLKTGSI